MVVQSERERAREKSQPPRDPPRRDRTPNNVAGRARSGSERAEAEAENENEKRDGVRHRGGERDGARVWVRDLERRERGVSVARSRSTGRSESGLQGRRSVERARSFSQRHNVEGDGGGGRGNPGGREMDGEWEEWERESPSPHQAEPLDSVSRGDTGGRGKESRGSGQSTGSLVHQALFVDSPTRVDASVVAGSREIPHFEDMASSTAALTLWSDEKASRVFRR